MMVCVNMGPGMIDRTGRTMSLVLRDHDLAGNARAAGVSKECSRGPRG